MKIFKDKDELIQHARTFLLEQRLSSLENDVKHCLFQNSLYQPAPFPALLYCFSTIDLLGSLYCGHATSGTKECNLSCKYKHTNKDDKIVCNGISSRSRRYMEDFLGYSSDIAYLLQNIFRHKLVHLAQPGPIVKDKKDNSRRIAWCHDERPEKQGMHLKIEKLEETEKIHVTPTVTIEYDQVFFMSIKNLVRDIRISVEKQKDGYLDQLEGSVELQKNYSKAISQIYG
jgi:hypothetical protein